MKTVYQNPKTESVIFQPQTIQMTSPFADPNDSGNGGAPKMDKTC